MISYLIPESWIKYDIIQVADSLVEAKASVQSLQATPYQKIWADEFQDYQLKREVAGTSRIEGADFTEDELDAAMKETPEELFTRSQKQARAAVKTYRTIANLPSEEGVTMLIWYHKA